MTDGTQFSKLAASGSTSLGSPLATVRPKTIRTGAALEAPDASSKPAQTPEQPAQASPAPNYARPTTPRQDKPAPAAAALPLARPSTATAPSRSITSKDRIPNMSTETPATTKPAATKAVAKPAVKKPAAKKAAAKPAAKKPVAKKAAAKPAAKKAVVKKAVAKPAAKKAAAKPAAKKPAAKPAAKKAVVKKAVAKPAAKKAAVKKAVAKPAAKKPAAKKRATSVSSRATGVAKKATTSAKKATTSARKAATSTARKAAPSRAKAKPAAGKSATSTRISAASKSLGEQVHRRVEEIVETGKTAKAAFDIVAREEKMTVANVQQHYYRFKRKATTQARSTAKRANTRAQSARNTVERALPTKQVEALGRKLRDDVDIAALGAEVVSAFGKLLSEARKDPRFRKLEKNVAQLLTR